jgi:peptidoglycan hydrolase-like protein with peptidoglycan-binding domain
MIKSISTSKAVAAVVGLGLAASLLLGVSVQAASAQSMTLAQLVNLFISLGIISPDKAAAAQAAVANQGTTASTASSYTYSSDLTVGSTGAAVTALQNQLGVSPATGYFGSITKAAVVAYQSANGVPSTGYVGALTRAKLNASSSSVTTTSGNTTTTTTVSTTGSTGSTVTNTGVEGILTVNLNSTPSSGQNVYAGDSKDALVGIKLQAQLSPITIQRVQVDLGSSSTIYNKQLSNLYLVSDTGQVLAQAALNPNTVTKQTSGSTNEYFLTFSGFNYTVPGDNSIHVLTVEGDFYSSISSTYFGNVTLSIDANGVRGVDGAGVDQYGPLSAISNSVNVQDSLSDSASLQLSTDSATPLAVNAVASQGSGSNELDGQTMLVFDLYAQKDWVQLDNLSGTFTTTGSGTASATTAYLYAGSNQVSSAAVAANGTFSFTNINYKISQNTTQPFTIKEDIKGANSTVEVVSVNIASVGVLAENSQGNTINSSLGSLTGSATGNQLTVNSAGAVFALASTPTITTQVSSTQNNTSTTTALANFVVQIQAVGGNAYFGTQAASTTFGFSIYNGGAAWALPAGATSTYSGVTSWVTPSSGVITTGLPGTQVAFELQQNNTVQIPVSFSFQNKTIGGVFIPTQTYAVGLDSINWSADGKNDITVTPS